MTTQKDDYIEIDLISLLKAMWHRAWAIVLSMLLFGAALFSYAYFLIVPTYQAKALMYVNNSSISVGSTSVSLSDLSASQTLVDTYIVILKTRLTLNEVIDRAELSYDYDDLCDMIDAKAVDSTEVFEITVTSEDPVEAEKIANTIAKVLPEKISEVMDGSSARIVDYAVVPTEKFAPSITKYTVIGLLLGLFISCGIITLRQLLDEQIRDEDQLTKTYGLPVLAVVPDLAASSKRKGAYGNYGYSSYYAAAAEEDGDTE